MPAARPPALRASVIAFALTLAGCLEHETYSSASSGDARCTIRDAAGVRCHQYRWYSVDTRNQLASTCIGPASSFDNDSGCDTDNALGACRFANAAPLVATYVYTGYADLADFIATCMAMNGTWDPSSG